MHMSINDETIQEAHDDIAVDSDHEQSTEFSVPKFNIKAIEVWINNTLKKVNPLLFPKRIIEDDSRSPLSRFGIDRKMLSVISFIT